MSKIRDGLWLNSTFDMEGENVSTLCDNEEKPVVELHEVVNVEHLQTKITDLENQIQTYKSRLEESEKHLTRKERQLEKVNAYNENLREEVERLSGELHVFKSRKVKNNVYTQTDGEAGHGEVITHISDAAITEDICVNKEEKVNATHDLTEVDDKNYEKGEGKSDDKEGVGSTSIADDLRATAEAALQQTGYVYDEKSGLYYDYKSGYYYDPAKQLFYDPKSGTYFYYNGETEKYEFHSQVDVSQYTANWQQQYYYQHDHNTQYSGHLTYKQHSNQPHYSKYRDRYEGHHNLKHLDDFDRRYEDRHHERHHSAPSKSREHYDKKQHDKRQRSKDKSPKHLHKSEDQGHHKLRKKKKKKDKHDHSKSKRKRKKIKENHRRDKTNKPVSSCESTQKFDINAKTSMQSELLCDKEQKSNNTDSNDERQQPSSVSPYCSDGEGAKKNTSASNEQLLTADSDRDNDVTTWDGGIDKGDCDDGELAEIEDVNNDSEYDTGVEEMDAEDSYSNDVDQQGIDSLNNAAAKQEAVKFVIKSKDSGKTSKLVRHAGMFPSESSDDDENANEKVNFCLSSSSVVNKDCSNKEKFHRNSGSSYSSVKRKVRDTSENIEKKNGHPKAASVFPNFGKISRMRSTKIKMCNIKNRDLLTSKCPKVDITNITCPGDSLVSSETLDLGSAVHPSSTPTRCETNEVAKEDKYIKVNKDGTCQSKDVKRNDSDETDSTSSSSLCTGESEIESGEITDSSSTSSESSVIIEPSLPEEVIMISDFSDEDGLNEDSDQKIYDLEEEEVASSWAPCIRVIVTDSDVLDPGILFIVTCTGATVGREKGMGHTLLIPDLNISKSHAEITYDTEQQKYLITDQGSQNGTFLNEVRLSETKMVSKPTTVNHGDVLQFGCTRLLLHIHPWTDTCDDCEPGQVQAQIQAKNQESKEIMILTKEEKKKLQKEQLKSIKKKYGLKNSAYVDNMAAIKKSGYKDKAEERRRTVGSDTPYQREEAPASVYRPIAEENKGHKLLKKMGWTEGQSLGKDNVGIQEPIFVKFRGQQSAGLGFTGAGEGSIDNIEQVTKRQKWLQVQERYNQSTSTKEDSKL